MAKKIFPQKEWYKDQLEALENYSKNLESRLIGKTIEIKYCDFEEKGAWKIKRIKVSGVGYAGNDKGYVDNDGPIFFDETGEGYRTHPDFGIRIIKK